MNSLNLPRIEIPQGKPNQYGITVKLGHFEPMTVVVPPLLFPPPFGSSTISVFIDGNLAETVVVDSSEHGPIPIVIKPYHLRCCWQVIHYSVFNMNIREESEVLMVLNET